MAGSKGDLEGGRYGGGNGAQMGRIEGGWQTEQGGEEGEWDEEGKDGAGSDKLEGWR